MINMYILSQKYIVYTLKSKSTQIKVQSKEVHHQLIFKTVTNTNKQLMINKD